MEVKLSICIPTYNRQRFLYQCLESILSSAKGYESKIEIIVSDNASTDQTGEVVSRFQKAYPYIQYHRNHTNIGGERNFYAAASLASGAYIWVFGDDDKVEEDAIPIVLRQIESEYDLIISNFSIWSQDFSMMKKERGISLKEDEIIEDPNSLMEKFGLRLGFISSVIIKKNLFLKSSPVEYEPFVEYGFPFLYSVYAGMLPRCHASYIGSPLVCCRFDNSGNYDWYKYFVEGTSLVFEALSLKGFSKSAVRRAKHRVLKDPVIYRILYDKREGRSLDRIVEIMIRHYKTNWMFWAICLPILYAPPILIRLIRGVSRFVRKSA